MKRDSCGCNQDACSAAACTDDADTRKKCKSVVPEHLYPDCGQSLLAELLLCNAAAPECLCKNHTMPQRNEPLPGCVPPDNGLHSHHAAAVGGEPAHQISRLVTPLHFLLSALYLNQLALQDKAPKCIMNQRTSGAPKPLAAVCDESVDSYSSIIALV